MGNFDPTTLAALIGIVLLLAVSALTAASEVALFSLNATHMRDLKDRGGTSGANGPELLFKPRRLLATILVMNNFANIGVTGLSTLAVAGPFAPTALGDRPRFITPTYASTAA